MFGIRKKVNPLSVQQIFPIVYSFFKDNNLEAFNLIKDQDQQSQTNLLLGTPQWTLVQLIDNYLVCKKNPNTYQIFLKLEKSLGLEILPAKFSDNLDFAQKFFAFHVYIRPLSEDDMKQIIEQSLKVKTSNNQLDNYVRMIKCLQRLEAEQNSIYEGSVEDKQIITEQLNLNEKLVKHYFKYRPELI